MPKYRLSHATQEDLTHIAEYGDEHYGMAKSNRYRDQLKTRFSIIAETPLLYPAVDYIKTGYRRSVCGAHAIYYRIEPGHVLIVRVLGQQDPCKALKSNQ